MSFTKHEIWKRIEKQMKQMSEGVDKVAQPVTSEDVERMWRGVYGEVISEPRKEVDGQNKEAKL